MCSSLRGVRCVGVGFLWLGLGLGLEKETQKEVPTKPGGQDVLVLKFKEGMFIN